MKMNPILNKELTLGSRSIKMPLALMIYNMFLGFIAIMILFSVQAGSMFGGTEFQMIMALFPILATVQCFIILILIPILTASSIAGERERQTLDVMLTTPISAFSIVMGKVLTAMVQVLTFLVSSIPIMSVAFIVGGLNWFDLLEFIVLAIYASFYVGAVGVFCSSYTKKTITSVILSFGIIFMIIFGTLVLFSILTGVAAFIQEEQSRMGQTAYLYLHVLPLIPLFNPAVTVGNGVVESFFGYGIADMVQEMQNISYIKVIPGTYFIMKHWNVVSIIVNTAVAFAFIKGAAKRINPLKKVKPVREAKKVEQA